jgi:hypothetical protein
MLSQPGGGHTAVSFGCQLFPSERETLPTAMVGGSNTDFQDMT